VIPAAVVTLAMVVALAVILESHLFTAVSNVWRVLGGVSIVLLLVPLAWVRLLGIAACATLVGGNYVLSRRRPTD